MYYNFSLPNITDHVAFPLLIFILNILLVLLLIRYNGLSREIRKLVDKITNLEKSEPFKAEMSNLLLEKLYSMGVINRRDDLKSASFVSASSFCKRRLPVVMVKSKIYKYK